MAPELRVLPVRLALACALLRALATQERRVPAPGQVVVTAGVLPAEVRQVPPYTIAPEGGSTNITCSTSGPLSGVYLKRRWPTPASVIYYEDQRQPTVDERFRGRAAFSGRQHNLTVTLSGLQRADAGVYVCQAVTDDVVWGPGTLVLVTDEVPQEADTCQKAQLTLVFPVLLAMSCFVLGLAVGAACVLRGTWVKTLCCTEEKNSACAVYEDMSYRGQNRMSTPNEYQ